MKKLLWLYLGLISFSGYSQDTVKYWNFAGLASLNMSQLSLTNWASGGQSSVSGTSMFNLSANYRKGVNGLDNTFSMAYGKIAQKSNKDWNTIKSDDKIEFTSKYGRAATKTLFYSCLLNFRSQFDKGYNYPNDSVAISKFLAPGYLTLAAGIDYKPSEAFSLYASPVTGKITFVTDDTLSDAGAFGVDPGKKTRSEIGSYIKISVNKNVMENVVVQSSVDLFSNYLDRPGNIDVNWQVLIGMKINKYLTASITTQLLYDDNIKIAKDDNENGIIDGGETHPRIQFKEAFAIGLSYKF